MTLAISDGNTVTLDFGNLNTDEQNIDALAFDSARALTVGYHGRYQPDDQLGGGLEYRRAEHRRLGF